MNSDLIPDRIQYGVRGLDLSELKPEPLDSVKKWLSEAVEMGVEEANAVCLSTVDREGFPDSRIVLVKEFEPGGVVFYTNYLSAKGLQLTEKPRGSMVFWWQRLRRQIRLRGEVVRVDEERSDAYFASRPRDSQLGAWASSQSRPLESRKELELRLEELAHRFPTEVPRPPHWGGFCLRPHRVEFWQGRDDRLHDRLAYEFESGCGWSVERLMP